MKEIIFKGTKTKLAISAYVALAVVGGFLLLAANSFLMRVVNDYLLVQNFDGFITPLLLTIGVFILVFAIKGFAKYLQTKFQFSLLIRLIEHCMELLLRTKSSYFIKISNAELYTKLRQSCDNVANLVGTLLEGASHITIFIFYGIIIFSIDMYAGIFTILFTPIYFFATTRVVDIIAELEHEGMEYAAELSKVTQETFGDVRNVKVKGVYSFFILRTVAALHKIKKNAVKSSVLEYYVSGITGLLSLAAPLLAIFAAMRFSPNFAGDAGAILVLYINIPLFLGSFESVYDQFVEYGFTKPFIRQLLEFNELELEKQDGVEIKSFEAIQTEGITVKFSDGRVVTVPDFEVKIGEKIMLVGESGAGKSTIFNIIMGLNQEYEGKVLVNGVNLREISLTSLRKIFGITFQDINIATLSLCDNIVLGRESNNARLEKLIKLTSLENLQETKGDEMLNNKVLSGGEKSRVGLSQMLVSNPQVMLLDEPFSNMDEELESQILTKILTDYEDRAIICISHRSSSEFFFDRVVRL
ncbi:MAG: ABC transporter ATP-binding protein/permease [Defluviitaleaceae bacterium]|nr:ABC transporter ATP-binding protein/permease [Defluviitaleaceae bacterium]MCL2274494.1 ABC transporter ATP-binding protein/permease [Defluviitaleaceae bacterium]